MRGLLVVLLLPGLAAAQSAGPAVAVDMAQGRHRISDTIYGMAEYGIDPAFQANARIAVLRWGGDATTRYNWQVDSSNAGFDWFFTGGNGEATPTPSGGPDALVRADEATGSQTLLTIPIIPYINSTSAWNCSFPESVYGPQLAYNPYIHPNGDNCGNGIAANGTQLVDTDILANHIPNTTAIQQGWVRHLVATFGTAAKGGVRYYQLDNEPYGWSNTHRDVEPGGVPYSTIVSLGQSYAAAVKQADPSAQVLGPSDFTLGGWIGDPNAQTGLFAGQYYLQQMAANAAASGRRVLDYFDEHYYFPFTDATSQLNASRSLWDPTYNAGTWVEQYYFYGPMMLLPRFRQWIAQYYPGTRLAMSEYSIDSGQGSITDALAEADVLGTFGWQGLDLAAMWNPPAPSYPTAFSFLLYRNYDGAGHGFGTVSVQAITADVTQVSCYASVRSDHVLTLVLINKTAAALAVPITLAHPAPSGTASVYTYSGANLGAIVAAPSVPFVKGAATVTLPGLSMSLLAIPI